MDSEFLTESKEFKNRKIKLFFKEDIEPQEVLLDLLAQKKEEEMGLSERKLETPLPRKILQGFYIFILILFLALFLKSFQFQIRDHKKYSTLARENKFIIFQIQAERGVIYDQFGNQLVWNKPSFDLYLQKNELPQGEDQMRVLREVAQIIKKDIEELKEKIEKIDSPQVLISENLSHQDLILLEAKIGSGKLPGFQIAKNFIRQYKDGETFSHLIGYTGKITSEELKLDPENYSIFDYVGRAGIESSYEQILRRDPGKLQVERDALGNIISKEVIKLPKSGKSLVLWLDADLQRKAKEILEKKLQSLGTEKGVVVALNPKTGGVLALVSLPSFDNNLFQKGADQKEVLALLEDPQKPLFNRAISGRYLTGSTIKPLIALAALEEKLISPTKQIYAKGFIEVPHRYNPKIVYKFRDWAFHGWTDMRKAIAQSVNVYFYTIGGGYGDQKGLGPTKMKQYLETFGWGKGTGIDLPGEVKGFIPDIAWKREVLKEGWWDGDSYYLAIGQGFLQITPIEVVTSFAAIANGGKLFQPQVVKAIVNENKEIIEEIKPKIIRENFIKSENLQVVREGMRRAVTGENAPLASARLLNSLPVSSAAKTGTAELGRDYYHNWITVFAPYEDPEIVLTVLIEKVKGAQIAALPVAKEILEWYFSRE